MDISPSAAVRAAMSSVDRIPGGRPERSRQEARAMEKAVAEMNESSRVSVNRIAENRAAAAMALNANASDRQRSEARAADTSAERSSGSAARQQDQRPGAVVDFQA